MRKTKLHLVIDEVNSCKEFKVGYLIADIENIYYDGGVSEMGKSTIRIYIKDLLNAHLIIRLGEGWYRINNKEREFKVPYLTGKELKSLKKCENLNMVLRTLSIRKLKENTSK